MSIQIEFYCTSCRRTLSLILKRQIILEEWMDMQTNLHTHIVIDTITF